MTVETEESNPYYSTSSIGSVQFRPGTSSSPLPYQADVYEENQIQRPAYITNVSHDHMDHEPHRIQVNGTVYMMKWSPDGSQLAVSASES